jgi:hypothetical protein
MLLPCLAHLSFFFLHGKEDSAFRKGITHVLKLSINSRSDYRTGDVDQAVEFLLCKYQIPSSNPSPIKKKVTIKYKVTKEVIASFCTTQ